MASERNTLDHARTPSGSRGSGSINGRSGPRHARATATAPVITTKVVAGHGKRANPPPTKPVSNATQTKMPVIDRDLVTAAAPSEAGVDGSPASAVPAAPRRRTASQTNA